MELFRDPAALRHWRHRASGNLAFVPTMGNLHEGHLSLVRLARSRTDRVLASIYVNPLQFGPGEDFSRYPRTPAEDLQKLRENGCHAVFLPEDAVMYQGDREDRCTVLPPRGLAGILCGAFRPGHFTGVCTVVLKLLHMATPDLLVLGEKDYQQYRILERMARDLDLPVQVLAGPTRRDVDGLALSSRNSLLPAELRPKAALLAAQLRELATLPAGGVAQEVAFPRIETLQDAGFGMDYLELRDSNSLDMVARIQSGARWFAAGRLGGVRLIDNMVVD